MRGIKREALQRERSMVSRTNDYDALGCPWVLLRVLRTEWRLLDHNLHVNASVRAKALAYARCDVQVWLAVAAPRKAHGPRAPGGGHRTMPGDHLAAQVAGAADDEAATGVAIVTGWTALDARPQDSSQPAAPRTSGRPGKSSPSAARRPPSQSVPQTAIMPATRRSTQHRHASTDQDQISYVALDLGPQYHQL